MGTTGSSSRLGTARHDVPSASAKLDTVPDAGPLNLVGGSAGVVVGGVVVVVVVVTGGVVVDGTTTGGGAGAGGGVGCVVVTAGGACGAGLATVVVVGSAMGATGRVVVVVVVAVVVVVVVVAVVVDGSLDDGPSASSPSHLAGAAIGTSDSAFVATFIATGSGSGALNGAAAEMSTSCPTVRSSGCAVIRSSNWKSLTVGDGTDRGRGRVGLGDRRRIRVRHGDDVLRFVVRPLRSVGAVVGDGPVRRRGHRVAAAAVHPRHARGIHHHGGACLEDRLVRHRLPVAVRCGRSPTCPTRGRRA